MNHRETTKPNSNYYWMFDFNLLQVYVKNFTLAIQKEFAPYGISIQLVTPMYVRTKMNNYSTTVMAGSILIPDVESYTKSVVFCLGKTNETTGYWTHGIQVCAPTATHFYLVLLRNTLMKN